MTLTQPPASFDALVGVDGTASGRFEGPSHAFGTSAAFGGQIFGQAVEAARRSVDVALPLSSFVASATRAGVAGMPLTYEVEALHDGRATTLRRIVVAQAERGVIATATVTFRAPEALDTSPLPAVNAPQAHDDESPFRTRFGFDALDVLHLNPILHRRRLTGLHPLWARARFTGAPTGDGGAFATFVSDLGIVLAAPEPGELRHAVPVTAEHALWFHRAPAVHEALHLHVERRTRTGTTAHVVLELRDVGGALVAEGRQVVAIRRRGVDLDRAT